MNQISKKLGIFIFFLISISCKINHIENERKQSYLNSNPEFSQKIERQVVDERGFSKEVPLNRVGGSQSHISYYKGAVVMLKLRELIGENKVNKALRNFLERHKFPKSPPVSTDLVNEFLSLSDKHLHPEIKELFMKI